MNHENENSQPAQSGFWRTRSGVALGVLGAIAGFLLISEHQAHLFQALPFLLVGACVVVHFFMHGGHGGHGGHGADKQPPSETPEEQLQPVPIAAETSKRHESH